MEKIMKIINEWDPIDLFPMAPKDEYIDEVRMIYEYQCTMPNLHREQLAEKINDIFVTKFGYDVYKEDINKCCFIADQIIGNKI